MADCSVPEFKRALSHAAVAVSQISPELKCLLSTCLVCCSVNSGDFDDQGHHLCQDVLLCFNMIVFLVLHTN